MRFFGYMPQNDSISMHLLLSFDTQLFFLINHAPHTWWADLAAEAFSGFGYAWILWLIISIILFIRKERKDHWFWVPLGIAAGLCYIISECALKNWFGRFRPDSLDGAMIVGTIPASFSFPSSHAVVAFAFAYLFSRKEVHWKWMYTLAVLVCLSRIYLGHHYPFDVLGGAVFGIVIGVGSQWIDAIIHHVHQRVFHRPSKRQRKTV